MATDQFNAGLDEDELLEVAACARCGGDHTGLVIHEFKRPIVDQDGTTWTHWSTCPETGDPFLHLLNPHSTLPIPEQWWEMPA